MKSEKEIREKFDSRRGKVSTYIAKFVDTSRPDKEKMSQIFKKCTLNCDDTLIVISNNGVIMETSKIIDSKICDVGDAILLKYWTQSGTTYCFQAIFG